MTKRPEVGDVSAGTIAGAMTEPGRYEFGDVQVDLRRMIVSVRGEPVALEPKSFDVLRYLIEHRDRLVGKDDLLNAVWGDTFVTPNVLTRAVAQLRRAIGDDAHNARYIETVVAARVSLRGPGHRGSRERQRCRRGAGATPFPVVTAAQERLVPPDAPQGAGPSACWPPSSWPSRAAPGGPSAAAPEASSAPARSFGLPRRVTTRSGVNTWPALSPDGRSVAYVSDRSGNLEIYVAGLAPGAREIAITSDGMQNMQPDWSPDGQWLAFHSRARRGVWIVPGTGGPARQVVEFGSDPAWSPDGQSLVFTSDAGAWRPSPSSGRCAATAPIGRS